MTRLRIISWNVAGIKARTAEIGRLVQEYKPDVMCFQKTRTVKVPSFDGYHGPAFCTDRWSGVATYMRSGLNAPLVEADTHHIVSDFAGFILINAYAPFSNAKVPGYIERRKEWDRWIVDFVRRQSKPVIICGDLNIVHTELDTFQKPLERRTGGYYNWERTDFNNLLQAGGMTDAFRLFHRDERAYTYFDTMHGIDYRALNQGSRLDYFLVSNLLAPHISGSDILTPHISGSDLLAPHISGSDILAPHISGSDILTPHISGSDILANFGTAPSVPITLDLNLPCP